jgi:chromate transporter
MEMTAMFDKIYEVFRVFLRLGMTSFGGPVAHLGYFHNEFVQKRKWIQETAYADLVALCQFLPGPASSQVGMAIGLQRAGVFGAVAAWLGFTLPSALFLTLFGIGISKYDVNLYAGWLHALKVVALAVVAQAIWSMGFKLCPDKKRISLMAVTCVITVLLPSVWTQLVMLALAGAAGIYLLKEDQTLPQDPLEISLSKSVASKILIAFAALLVVLPLLAVTTSSPSLQLFDSFFRTGSLVFGGGHVVLPLLQTEVVKPGWVSQSMFMAGYGAAQGIPGPLFSFSAYLGAVSTISPNSWWGAWICMIAIFLPSFLLVMGLLPFWEKVRSHQKVRFALLGVNAAVVGLLLAAFYQPVWTSSILSAKDFSLALIAFILLMFWKLPSWTVVLVGALSGMIFY